MFNYIRQKADFMTTKYVEVRSAFFVVKNKKGGEKMLI